MHTTVEQNKAHREDLNWARLKGGVYLATNGWTIQKNNNTSRWLAFDETGQQATREIEGYGVEIKINEHSLSWAKYVTNEEIERRARVAS